MTVTAAEISLSQLITGAAVPTGNECAVRHGVALLAHLADDLRNVDADRALTLAFRPDLGRDQRVGKTASSSGKHCRLLNAAPESPRGCPPLLCASASGLLWWRRSSARHRPSTGRTWRAGFPTAAIRAPSLRQNRSWSRPFIASERGG